VTLKQLAVVFGQAHWWEPELQFPQAPPPALPQGPHEEPQQNHDISPYAGEALFEQPMGCLRSVVDWSELGQACPGATDGEEGNLRRQQVSQNKVSTKDRVICWQKGGASLVADGVARSRAEHGCAGRMA
jgi:hypothetical protein